MGCLGYGSNLTLNGTVECDAAIMDGRSGDFGSVGAVSGTLSFDKHVSETMFTVWAYLSLQA